MHHKNTKKLCPTRWSSKYDSLLAIKNNFKSISQFLSQVIFMSKKSSERNEALGLRKQLENFEFILCLVLESINVVSKMLQSPNTDLQKATHLLGQAKSSLCELG